LLDSIIQSMEIKEATDQASYLSLWLRLTMQKYTKEVR